MRQTTRLSEFGYYWYGVTAYAAGQEGVTASTDKKVFGNAFFLYHTTKISTILWLSISLHSMTTERGTKPWEMPFASSAMPTMLTTGP